MTASSHAKVEVFDTGKCYSAPEKADVMRAQEAREVKEENSAKELKSGPKSLIIVPRISLFPLHSVIVYRA
jgi:hypothetical protein